MREECTICGAIIPDTHPTCGEGWDVCESCKEGICDAVCADIPFYCPHCYKDLTDKDFIGEWELPGDALHAPGKFWVFQHTDNTCCEKWSRCHVSTENSFVEAWKEIKEQRETMANEEKSLPDAQ